jgi:hypothetical protein
VLVGAAFFASRGLSGTTEEPSSEVAPAPESAPAAPAERPAAATSIRQALRGSEPAKSGTFELSFSAAGVNLTAEGKFQSAGLAEVPKFEIDLESRADGGTIEAGAVSDGKRGYLVSGDRAVVVAPGNWNALVRGRSENAKRGPNGDDFNNYSQRELDSFEFRGRETIAGTPVLHFVGKVDPAQARQSFAEIAGGLRATGLDSPVPGQLARSVESGTIEAWVGANDHILRRERVEFRYSGGEATYDLSRAAINEPQRISAPKDAKPAANGTGEGLDLAFSALVTTIFAVEPAAARSDAPSQPVRERQGGQGSGNQDANKQQPGKQDSRKQAARKRDSHRQGAQRPARRQGTGPAAVRRALAQQRIVLLFFRQQGADDDAVAEAVSSVRGRSGVSVFTLPVGQAPKYAEVGAADVVRAPTIVLLRRGDEPRIFEGFIDSETLAQAVTDAR